jgi:hypothetical protein
MKQAPRFSRFALTMADSPRMEIRLRALLDVRPRQVVFGAVAGAVAGVTAFTLMLAALRPAPSEPNATQLAEMEMLLREIRDELRDELRHAPTVAVELPSPPRPIIARPIIGGTHAEWVKTADCRSCHRTEDSYRLRDYRGLAERIERYERQIGK